MFMYCENCGCSLKEGALFCETCGTPVYAIPTVLPDGTELIQVSDDRLGWFSIAGVYMMLLAILIFTGIALAAVNGRGPCAARREAAANTGKMMVKSVEFDGKSSFH